MYIIMMSIFGTIVFTYGIYTIIVRIREPGKLRKLAIFQKYLGPKIGYIVHCFFYSVLPILFGLGILFLVFILI